MSILALGFGAPKGSNPALRAGLLASSALFIGSSRTHRGSEPGMDPAHHGAWGIGGHFAGATVFSLMAPEGRMLSLVGPFVVCWCLVWHSGYVLSTSYAAERQSLRRVVFLRVRGL